MNTPSLQECETYLREVIREADKISLNARQQNQGFFRRNFFLYSWLLQKDNISADLVKLSSLLGISVGQLDIALQTATDITPYIETRASALQLTGNMERAVEKVFNEDEFRYNIGKSIPFFKGLIGYQFLEYINELKTSEKVRLGSIVATAFKNALPGVEEDKIDEQMPNIRLVRIPKKWAFVLVVFPNYGMLDDHTIGDLIRQLYHLNIILRNQELDNLHILLVAPNVNDQGKQLLGKDANLHHFWGLSTLRFFHELKKLLDQCDDQGKAMIAENFVEVFLAQDASTTFNIQQGFKPLEVLKKN